jgi:hypothetical protein
MLDEKTLKRFWTKVNVKGSDECWPWLAAVGPDGYGRFSIGGRKGRMYYAPRVSWAIHNGSIPLGSGHHGTCVCHSCDNRLCVNPRPLFLGSQGENLADAGRKGHMARNTRGERNGHSKLTDGDVLAIRLLFSSGDTTQRALAERFGISRRNINDIIHRKRWFHI